MHEHLRINARVCVSVCLSVWYGVVWYGMGAISRAHTLMRKPDPVDLSLSLLFTFVACTKGSKHKVPEGRKHYAKDFKNSPLLSCCSCDCHEVSYLSLAGSGGATRKLAISYIVSSFCPVSMVQIVLQLVSLKLSIVPEWKRTRVEWINQGLGASCICRTIA